MPRPLLMLYEVHLSRGPTQLLCNITKKLFSSIDRLSDRRMSAEKEMDKRRDKLKRWPKAGNRSAAWERSEKNIWTPRPVLMALTLPVLVRVAIHQLPGYRVTFFLEPLGTVHRIRMICRQPQCNQPHVTWCPRWRTQGIYWKLHGFGDNFVFCENVRATPMCEKLNENWNKIACDKSQNLKVCFS